MKLKVFLSTFFALVALVGAQTQPFPPGESLPYGTYLVERVIDGDTFVVTYEGVQRSVRVIGVNTPELHPPQSYAVEATQFTRNALNGRSVELVPGEDPTDRFARALAYVTVPSSSLGDRDLALDLAMGGFAVLDIRPPNVLHAKLYAAAVQGAVSVRKGMYAASPGPFVDRNCGYFKTQEEAQAFFSGAVTYVKRDPHGLDPDRNGLACQNLPRLR